MKNLTTNQSSTSTPKKKSLSLASKIFFTLILIPGAVLLLIAISIFLPLPALSIGLPLATLLCSLIYIWSPHPNKLRLVFMIGIIIFALWAIYWYLIPNPLVIKRVIKDYFGDSPYQRVEIYTWVTLYGRVYSMYQGTLTDYVGGRGVELFDNLGNNFVTCEYFGKPLRDEDNYINRSVCQIKDPRILFQKLNIEY